MPILKDPPARRMESRPEPLRMSEAEFVKWSGEEGVRAEWVDGEVIFMRPVAVDHADLAVFLVRLVGGFVDENDLGKLWSEPFQVRLPKQRRR